jgi:hypothetical protein
MPEPRCDQKLLLMCFGLRPFPVSKGHKAHNLISFHLSLKRHFDILLEDSENLFIINGDSEK